MSTVGFSAVEPSNTPFQVFPNNGRSGSRWGLSVGCGSAAMRDRSKPKQTANNNSVRFFMLCVSSRFCHNPPKSYWKNFTLCAGPDEVWVALNLLTQISRWVNSGEADEIVSKMGLVEISATVSDIGPDHLFAGMNLGQHLLKTTNPAE